MYLLKVSNDGMQLILYVHSPVLFFMEAIPSFLKIDETKDNNCTFIGQSLIYLKVAITVHLVLHDV